jgi:hypothetical protein
VSSARYRLVSIPLFWVLFATSCVPHFSCIRTVDTPIRESFLTLHVFSDPIEKIEGSATGHPVLGKFKYAAVIGIDVAEDGSGRLSVRTMGARLLSCSRIAAEDLGELSRSWRPVLERSPTPNPKFQVMATPYTEDWRPDGPLISLSFGSPLSDNVGLLWDGRSNLPDDLDKAVVATLELLCSTNRTAREQLLHGLPQLSGRLECQ